MKPRRSITTVAKWGGVIASAMLIAAWIAGGWWDVEWVLPGGLTLALERGFIGLSVPPPAAPLPTGLALRGPAPWTMVWGIHWVSGPSFWELVIPLWIPTIAAVLATALVWRADAHRRRRAAANLCSGCGYDRSGLTPGAICPECGAQADIPSPSKSHG